jgi:hypothetical protein
MNSLDVPCQVPFTCVVPGTDWFAEIAEIHRLPGAPLVKKKNLPNLRIDAILRGSNEEGLLALHVAGG